MIMHDDNKRTLLAYENGVAEYTSAMIPSVVGSVKDWVDESLVRLPPHAHILEIGSAHGRDADYMESKGIVVDRTDAAKSFIDYMNSKGHKAYLLNALTDDYGGPFDMVYANAVLLHFSAQQCVNVLERVRHSLKPNGIFSFSVKIGDGSKWSHSKLKDPRFFRYWQEQPLRDLLTKCQYEVIYWHEDQTGHDNSNWYHVIAKPINT